MNINYHLSTTPNIFLGSQRVLIAHRFDNVSLCYFKNCIFSFNCCSPDDEMFVSALIADAIIVCHFDFSERGFLSFPDKLTHIYCK